MNITFSSVYGHLCIVSSSPHNLPVIDVISKEQMRRGRLREAKGQ